MNYYKDDIFDTRNTHTHTETKMLFCAVTYTTAPHFTFHKTPKTQNSVLTVSSQSINTHDTYHTRTNVINTRTQKPFQK